MHTEKQRQMKFVLQVQPDASFTFRCHRLCSLFYSTSVVTSGMRVPGVRCKALSISSGVACALSLQSAPPITTHRKNNQSAASLSQKWQHDSRIRLIFVMPYWSTTLFCSPSLQGKEERAGSAAESAPSRWMIQCRSRTFQQGRCLLSGRFWN